MLKTLIRHSQSTKPIDLISALVTQIPSHSLLDSLYTFKHSQTHYGYIIQDKRTQNLIAIDCGDYKTQRFNIEDLMKKTGGSFTHLFLTSSSPLRSAGTSDWRRVHPGLSIIAAGSKPEGHIEFIGDLCVYFMKTPWSDDSDTTYVITEVNENSTKTPIVFTGNTLMTGGCGQSDKFDKMVKSLSKIKNLPNETMIFPAYEFARENLMFAKIIDPGNEFVVKKLEEVKSNERNFGQLLGHERLYNPFLRADQKFFLDLFEAQDHLGCFTKMVKLKEKLLKSQY